jgi:hypothetical protein
MKLSLHTFLSFFSLSKNITPKETKRVRTLHHKQKKKKGYFRRFFFLEHQPQKFKNQIVTKN